MRFTNPADDEPFRHKPFATRHPAFSVLLIMAALAVIGVAMLPMLNVQYTPSPVERKIDVSFTWPTPRRA